MSLNTENTMKTQAEIRKAFWAAFPDLPRKRTVKTGNHRDYPCDTRCAFVEFVDSLARSGEISESLASRVTL